MNHPTPKPYLLQRVYDIRSWIESHAVELHAHTVPKCFKFELNDAGKAVMYYRNWSHEQWLGPIVVLKHPSVTDPVESLSSLGFWKKRHWVGKFPTGSAYFPVGFFHKLIRYKNGQLSKMRGFYCFSIIPFPASGFFIAAKLKELSWSREELKRIIAQKV